MEQSQNLPRHVLIIPDGNRRWVKEHGKPGSEGHLEGAKRFHEVSKAAFGMGIKHFTFWVASGKNLAERSHYEIMVLLFILRQELGKPDVLRDFLKNQTRFKVLGGWYEILHEHHFGHLRELLHLIRTLQERTESFDQHFLTLLFGYTGKGEGLKAVRITLPPVDLMIRTASCEEGPCWAHNSCGIVKILADEGRLYSPPTLWPDFTADEFRKAIEEYSKVPRRHGA